VVLEGTGAMTPFDIADDGRWILVGKYLSIAESELYRLDLATGRLTEINPTNGKVAYGDAELSPTAARSTSPRRGFGRAAAGPHRPRDRAADGADARAELERRSFRPVG
jgi:hypothetical protein